MSTMASRRSSAGSSTTPARCWRASSRRSRRCRRGAACRSNGRSCSTRSRPSATRASPSTPPRSASAPPRATSCMIDAPGHKEFLKNMVTGAAAGRCGADRGGRRGGRRGADAAARLSAAPARRAPRGRGRQQDGSRRLFGRRGSRRVSRDLVDHLAALGLDRRDLDVVPVSAREGDNIAASSARMAWHAGPTLIEALDALPPADARRSTCRCDWRSRTSTSSTSAGSLPGGSRAAGSRSAIELLFSPARRRPRRLDRVLGRGRAPRARPTAGQSIGITLDEQIFVERGDVASHHQLPPTLANVFRARLFWLGRTPARGRQPLPAQAVERRYEARASSGSTRVIDTGDLSTRPAEGIERNQVGEVVIHTRSTVAARRL